MDTVVHNNEPPSTGRVLRIAEPGVQKYGDVVIPVEEDQGLLPQHYENSITQLWKFTQDKHPRPEARNFVLFDETGHTHRVVEAVVGEGVEELRDRAAGADDAERGQQRVPEAEDSAEFEPRPVLHEVLPAEDEHHVDADVVEAQRPVVLHPGAGLLVDEVRLEVEHIGIVGGCDLVVLLHRGTALKHFLMWKRDGNFDGYIG